MKRTILIISILTIFMTVSSFAATADIPLTEEQKKVEILGFAVKWVDVGAGYKAIWHDGQQNNSSKGMYYVQGIMEDGSNKYGFINANGEIEAAEKVRTLLQKVAKYAIL